MYQRIILESGRMGTPWCCRRAHLLFLVHCLLWQQTGALHFLFLPFHGGNSPSMDLMGVASALQAR